MSYDGIKLAEEISQLPWETLVIFSAGYMGYFVSTVGLKQRNSTIDVLFTIFIFGLFAALVYKITITSSDSAPSSGIIVLKTTLSVLAAVLIAGLWRFAGRPFLYLILRKLKVSNTDAHDTVLSNLFDYTGACATQLTVYLKSGNVLMCDNLSLFSDKPCGTFKLGIDGDVLMYVTHQKSNGTWEEDKEVISETWGSEITYVPTREIERISIRFK